MANRLTDADLRIGERTILLSTPGITTARIATTGVRIAIRPAILKLSTRFSALN